MRQPGRGTRGHNAHTSLKPTNCSRSGFSAVFCRLTVSKCPNAYRPIRSSAFTFGKMPERARPVSKSSISGVTKSHRFCSARGRAGIYSRSGPPGRIAENKGSDVVLKVNYHFPPGLCLLERNTTCDVESVNAEGARKWPINQRISARRKLSADLRLPCGALAMSALSQ
jgi:hypothetical protein